MFLKQLHALSPAVIKKDYRYSAAHMQITAVCHARSGLPVWL